MCTAPDRRTYVSDLSAGGGRVAFETERGRYESAVFAMDAETGALVELGRGRARDNWDCGRAFKLDDVSPAGDVLFEEATVPCSSRRGRLLVRADGPSGERTLVSRRADALSTLVEGLLPDRDAEATCDDGHLVLTVAVPRRVDRVYVYDLPT
jgi:hypothetical protein